MTILASELQPGMLLRLADGIAYLVTRVSLQRSRVYLRVKGTPNSKARPLWLRAASRVEISVHPITEGAADDAD